MTAQIFQFIKTVPYFTAGNILPELPVFPFSRFPSKPLSLTSHLLSVNMCVYVCVS